MSKHTSSPAEEAQDGINTRLLAGIIFGMVIHGIGTKRQLIDNIANEIDVHRPSARPMPDLTADIETVRHHLRASNTEALAALDRIEAAIKGCTR